MSGSSSSRPGPRAAAILLVVALLAIVVAACGGSGSSSGSGSDSASAGGSGGGSGSAAADEFVVASKDEVVDNGGTTEITSAAYPSGKDTDEVNVTGAKPVKPCRLVTKSEAATILGKGVSVTERLQGPTCVYSNAGRQVTLAVAEASIKALRQGARKSRRVEVAGRRGYCLTYESTLVVVPYDRSHILQVNGPCQAGVRFAAAALS